MKDIFDNIITVEWKHDGNHAHVLFRAHLNIKLSEFINAYKSVISRLVKKEFL